MTERDEIEAQLGGYVQSLPTERRPPRERTARRERLLPHLRAHASRERQRVQRRRAFARAAGLVALGGAAAAAAAALWIALPARTPGTAATAAARVSPASALTVIDGALWLRGDTGARALREGESVALADLGAFEAPVDRPARVQVSDVVAMILAPSSRARTMVSTIAGSPNPGAPVTQSLAIALERGRAHFEVQKLRGGRRFHVMTPDADVEVRGTIFSVALPPYGDAPTCVAVEEGLVQVAKGVRTRLLARGDSWDCAGASETNSASAATATRVTAPSSQATAIEPKRDRSRAVTRTGRWTPAGARGAPSDLRAQNQIFQAALSAERGGRLDEAERLYRKLLARAPDGPLAAQARANLAAVAGVRR